MRKISVLMGLLLILAVGTERSAASAKKMGVPPGNRPAVPRDWPEAYLNGTPQGPEPEDARMDGNIRGRSR